jgi:hypothetical protein
MEEFNMKRGLVITESFEGEEKIKNKDLPINLYGNGSYIKFNVKRTLGIYL